MKKLCCIFNTPSSYRERIYRCIDNEFECDWYFEDIDYHLKEFPLDRLKRAQKLPVYKRGPFYGIRGCLKLLWKRKYSHIIMMGHPHNLTTSLIIVMAKLFFPNKRTYLWTHGLYGNENNLRRLWKLLLFHCADGLFIYGDRACSLIKNAGIKSTKIFPIHNSLDYPTQIIIRKDLCKSNIYVEHFANSFPVLIFIGRLTESKRLDMLVKAIHQLKIQGYNFNLVLIGDGKISNTLKQMAQKYDIEQWIWFYGESFDEYNNADLIYNADLCVSPGNIGLTAIHTLMFGCPALTHDEFPKQGPEYEAIIENQTGCFFERGNQESLNQAIIDWFQQPNYDREKIRQACYAEIDKNWNPDYQMKLIHSVIK